MRYFLLRLKRFCGFLTGFVFFISGILKLMDPVGASLVMKEYFQFLHIGFMTPAAMTSGLFFAFSETVIGAGLITGVWRRITALAAVIFQGFFTLLTLLLVIFNPEMDCGCLGEAVHLTHKETFAKNLVLMTLLLTYYIPARHLGQTRKKKYVSFGVVMTSVVAFAAYSFLYLPLNDYTDYHSGVSIKTVEAAAEDYHAVFLYEKDGVQKRFSMNDLPDSTWTFVSTETIRIGGESEETAPLSFLASDGEYADSLAYDGSVMVISIYDTDIDAKTANRLAKYAEAAKEAGFQPLVLTSAPSQDFPEAYTADYKTLVTLNRSNGGATYIKDGLIISKWAERNLPAPEELAEIYREDVTETIIGNSRSSIAFQGFLLYVFAVMLLL